MIKLTRLSKPSFLTDDKVNELTLQFKIDASSVWNVKEIKTPLLLSSHNKCAYCECPLTLESNYMEVEHFEDKKNNPDKVVIWENLLPSCKRCNGAKSGHDVITDPIVNPYVDDPKQHLAWRLYHIRSKSAKGVSTIETVDLNNSDRLVYVRYRIGEKIHSLVEKAQGRLDKFLNDKTIRNRNKIVSTVEGLLKECQLEADYAASTATLLLTDQTFTNIKSQMINESIWNNGLQSAFQRASEIKLDYI